MKQLILLFAFLILVEHSLIAQQNIPVIKATSYSVDIRNGKKLLKNSWTISPEIKPDIYWTSTKNGNVTFYTDIDSISFNVQIDKEYYFIILLNGKDSALTLIKYIDLIKMSFPVSLISQWDTAQKLHPKFVCRQKKVYFLLASISLV